MVLDLPTIFAALGLYLVGVASPGPNFALVSRLSVVGLKRSAFGATLGLASASMLYAVLTMSGLALVLTSIGWVSTAIQIAGGSYLVYLGLKSWLTAGPPTQIPPTSAASGRFWRGFRSGTLVNLANPKCIAFFVSLYSVVIPADATPSTRAAVLLGGFLLEVIWYGLVVFLLSTSPVRSAFGRFGLWIERGIGTILAAFGIRLISEKL